jgi:hypothetical protein
MAAVALLVPSAVATANALMTQRGARLLMPFLGIGDEARNRAAGISAAWSF